jgi:hypothetical protein
MNNGEPPGQGVPMPAEWTFGSQGLLASNSGTDHYPYPYMDTFEPTANAPGVITAGPGYIVPIDEYQNFRNNATGFSHGHVQGPQTLLHSPKGGVPSPMVPQSSFLSSPTVEMAIGTPPAPGSQPWYKDIFGQTYLGLVAMNDYGLQEQPHKPFGCSARATIVYRNDSRGSAPWSIPFPYETGGPVDTIPMSLPTNWDMGILDHSPCMA